MLLSIDVKVIMGEIMAVDIASLLQDNPFLLKAVEGKSLSLA